MNAPWAQMVLPGHAPAAGEAGEQEPAFEQQAGTEEKSLRGMEAAELRAPGSANTWDPSGSRCSNKDPSAFRMFK